MWTTFRRASDQTVHVRYKDYARISQVYFTSKIDVTPDIKSIKKALILISVTQPDVWLRYVKLKSEFL